MRILITGSNGLLGQKIVDLCLSKGLEFLATSSGANRYSKCPEANYATLDITDEANIKAVLEHYLPTHIIHTAAMTNVDACEEQPEACDLVNRQAVYMLAKASQVIGAHFQLLSTDFVFDGEAGPYSETDKPNPISYYGHSKYNADVLVEESAVSWAIVRTIIVYGVVDNMSRSNLVLWAKSALQKGEKINVINDQFRAPTLAEDLAEGCMLIADKKAKGIYNISGRDTYSILDLVYQIADFWQLNKSLIQVVSSATLDQPAKRPPRTGFILDKAINQLGYKPKSFREGLNIIDKQLKGLEK